jgi:hypothetical protein
MIKLISLSIMMFAASVHADELKLDETYSISFQHTESFSPSIIHDPADQFRPSLLIIHHKTDGSEDFYAKVQFLKIDSAKAENGIDSAVHGLVESQCSEMVNTSIENEARVLALPGETLGYYCTLTDKSVEPDDAKGPSKYRVIAFSSVSYSDLINTAVAFSNSTDDQLFKDYLELLSSIKIVQNPPVKP